MDKPDVRTVIHRDLSPSVESYLQESGRAGRDRKQAWAVYLFSMEDITRSDSFPDSTERNRFSSLLEYAADGKHCRREKLLGLLDAAPEVCFGCDICSGTAEKKPAGLQILIDFIRKYRRDFSVNEAALLLSGEASPEIWDKALWRNPFYRSLSGWTFEETTDALRHLAEHNPAFFIRGKGPWKGKLGYRNRFTGKRALPDSRASNPSILPDFIQSP